MTDPQTRLDHARRGLDRAPDPIVDGVVAFLSTLQLLFGTFYVIVLATAAPPAHDADWGIMVAGMTM